MKWCKLGILFIMCSANLTAAEQILPPEIIKITQTIEVQKTGEKGKTYFYCSNGKKCSTEDVVKDYYQNKGYKVMRGEVDFWFAMFALAFFDEIFGVNMREYGDIPSDMFSNDFYNNRKKTIDEKYKYLKSADLSEFINIQIEKHGDFKTRLFYNIPDEHYSMITYFKKPIVQEFLKRINQKTFAKITYRIAQNPNKNRAGIADFIIWNDKELVFVEVKREKETLRPGQIPWAQFMLKNKIPVVIMRVKGI
jgi:Holliday junction resolvase-like predicted endonuclease